MQKVSRETPLMNDNKASVIVEDTREALNNAGFAESESELFIERAIGVLDDYAVLLGKDVTVRYMIRNGITRLELHLIFPGKEIDPFVEGDYADNRSFDRMFNVNPNLGTLTISYRYRVKYNVVTISIPKAEKPRKKIRDPILWSVVLGAAFGLLCGLLPGDVSAFIVDEIASPLQNIILSLISGVMGPVIFFSLITSVLALEDIHGLTGLGFRIIGRFLGIILFLILVSVLFSALFFNNFGSGETGFSMTVVSACFSILSRPI